LQTPPGSPTSASDEALAAEAADGSRGAFAALVERYGARVQVPEHIVCVDCGGRCHLLSYPPDEGFVPGDVVAYRCEDCLDRWDLVMDDTDD